MDDCHHEPARFHPTLTRKRKADTDDRSPAAASDPAPADSLLLGPDATPRIPAEPTDQASASWLLAHHHSAMLAPWQESLAASASSPSFAAHAHHDGPSRPKRPRIDIPRAPPMSPRKSRRGRVLYSSSLSSPKRFVRVLRPASLRDTGVVSAVEPRTLVPLQTGSLSPSESPARTSLSLPATPIEPSPAHVPSHQPPINRDTLKELDLDAILRNPQLRHDLLFDSGLQFRPTFSRRKRDMAESYWIAVVRELESGCTCTTLDTHGRPIERRCICSAVPMPSDKLVRAHSSAGNFVTVRSPSRLRPLLSELLEVLVSIIRPVVLRPQGLCLHPGLLPPQEQNDSHVAYLRSILDADLIQQELNHGVFDPSGVFKAIGDIMRCYCAPMRDQGVNQMVALADSCSPGGTGSKADAVRAIRLCFEILELMKLDVANHQLQTLRPYLVHTAAPFELKMFQENRQKSALSLDATRRWLQTAYDALAAQNAPRPSPSVSLAFSRYPRHLQVQLAVVKAIVDSVFDPPSLLPSTPASPQAHGSPRQAYPETLYLDHVRLTTLRNDAADFTTLYMLLMLYRQLVHSGPPSTTPTAPRPAISPDEFAALKKEIWEIGPARLGLCFTCRPPIGLADGSPGALEADAWRKDMDDVVLQLATRAGETRLRARHPASKAPAPSSSLPPSADHHAPPSTAPDGALLRLATSWTDSHLRTDSALSTLMRKRVKRAVEAHAVQLTLPALPRPAGAQADAAASGLEPLLPEIRHLAEKLSKLVSIHLNVYGTLYTQPGFVVDRASPAHA